VVVAVVFIVLSVTAFVFFNSRPPREGKLLKNFEDHRIAYARLRDMFLQDEQVIAVYTRFGVETNRSGLPRPPSEVNFPDSRYDQYVSLLKEVGGSEIFRRPGRNPGICITVWAAGFAGNTSRVSNCWLPDEPVNQVGDLKNGNQQDRTRTPVYRRIEENWYISFDR
jgi:hypothetical protein